MNEPDNPQAELPDDEAAGFLLLARLDLKAAGLIEIETPLQAMFSLQQAAEKMLKAVLSVEGLPYPKIHDIAKIANGLPDGHPWKDRLGAFDRLTPAATSMRYPTLEGGTADAPTLQALQADRLTLAGLLTALEPWVRAKLAG